MPSQSITLYTDSPINSQRDTAEPETAHYERLIHRNINISLYGTRKVYKTSIKCYSMDDKHLQSRASGDRPLSFHLFESDRRVRWPVPLLNISPHTSTTSSYFISFPLFEVNAVRFSFDIGHCCSIVGKAQLVFLLWDVRNQEVCAVGKNSERAIQQRLVAHYGERENVRCRQFELRWPNSDRKNLRFMTTSRCLDRIAVIDIFFLSGTYCTFAE